MKAVKLVLGAGLAIAATAAFAETGVKLTQIDHVTYVYGRASVPTVKLAGAVVTRPADHVVVGSVTESGKTAVAVATKAVDASRAFGRS
ncbi:MAG TPA: hypothetical protein VFB20_03495 [Burkholderiales bacterium]|nr:hypothetical protein [Burkholderiales bacterium]